MQKTGRTLTILGICLCILLAVAVGIFILGMLAFIALGEQRYFAGYVALKGYFPIVNLMFLLDYISMGVGSLGIPTLIVGLILKGIGKNAG